MEYARINGNITGESKEQNKRFTERLQRGNLDTTKTPKQIYEYMSEQTESISALSLEIQERYGST